MIDNKVLFEKLFEIDRIIKSVGSRQSLIGILNGISGISLFQFYYSRLVNSEESSSFGSELLSLSFERINTGFGYPTFCNGIAGVGWAMDHLLQAGFIDSDNDQILPELDEYLHSKMTLDFENKNYDFLHGSIGYGLYFLNRLRNTNDESLKVKYEGYLVELLNFLNNMAEFDKDVCKWQTILDKDIGHKGYNFSLSHGIPSILNFLTRLNSLQIFKYRVEPLLKSGINYLLSYLNPDENSFSLFPSSIAIDGIPDYHSRVAWCYGDMGIGITFWKAAKIFEDSSLTSQSIQILKHSARRRSFSENLVKDAGVCHGAFGVAHMFNKMYRETLDPIFKESCDFWMLEGLKMSYHSDGLAGFKKWRIENKEVKWENEVCLLEGIAGIGLVIIDYLSESNNTWDECLLLS